MNPKLWISKIIELSDTDLKIEMKDKRNISTKREYKGSELT